MKYPKHTKSCVKKIYKSVHKEIKSSDEIEKQIIDSIYEILNSIDIDNAEFKELKNIDRATMMSVLEDIFRTQLARMYGDADNFDIINIRRKIF